MKDDLNLILDDLPDGAIAGRSGHPAGNPTAARVSKTVSPQMLRSQLKHLGTMFDKKQLTNIQAKYRKLPDFYYEDDQEKIITPLKFDETYLKLPRSKPVLLWELCSGSSKLSASALQSGLPHLPPIDFRFGWLLGRDIDQL